MPDSIDGVPRLTTDQYEAVERAIEAVGGHAQVAAYGSGNNQSFLVVVYEEPTEVDLDQEFRAFSFSFMGTSGVDLDPASIVDENLDGVHYRCQSDVEETISVCLFGGGRHFRGSDDALALARKVQTATAGVTP